MKYKIIYNFSIEAAEGSSRARTEKFLDSTQVYSSLRVSFYKCMFLIFIIYKNKSFLSNRIMAPKLKN